MSMTWLPADPVVVERDGLVLREWTSSDVSALVELYDTPEMDRRTPVAYPFTSEIAHRCIENARHRRSTAANLQLAITEDGTTAVGEILVAPTDTPGTVELAYAVNQAHTGRGIARRAVRSILAELASLPANEVERARLLISDDNTPSQRVAQATGFVRTDKPIVVRRRKSMEVELATWDHILRQ